MTKTPAIRGLLAGFLLLAGSVTHVHAQAKYTPAQMLDPRLAPKMDDVVLTTPSPDELSQCTVVAVQGTAPKSGGFLLLDAKKQPLRRFFDSKGGGSIDVWSYYKDGVEVYREFDTAYKGTPNNFRWLNSGGMKWGIGSVDAKTGRGYITGWRMISAEEVGYEAFQAVARQDYARLQLLLVTDAEMQMIKLPVAKIKAVAATQQLAQKKFADLVKTINLNAAKFEIVEGGIPNCDTTGDVESIKYPSRAIRYELKGGDKKHDWLHTGEMIQVGMAWRLVDVPTDKDPTGVTDPNLPRQKTNPALDKLLQELADLDLNPPPLPPIGAKQAKTDVYLRQRIAVIQKIIPIDDASKREGWYRQLFDNLMSLAQNAGDDATIGLLKTMTDDVVAKMPGSGLAAYGVYREAWTRYAIGMAKTGITPPEITKLQDKWLDDLGEFVKKYQKADDTPEALRHLGNGCEFSGKDEQAKRWYTQLFDNFPNHALADHARGSVNRLNLIGKELTLAAPLLADGSKFDIAQLKGKVVFVHYWASYSEQQYKDDFLRLKRFMDQVGTEKKVALVCINLDDTAEKAKAAIAAAQAPGIHLYQAPSNNGGGGTSSPLATQYGIHILPTMFMVDREGRVRNNALQIGDIETELKKVQ